MSSSNASPSSGGNWIGNNGPTLDISDLSESGMRRLLIILKENNPNALRDAMSVMVNAEGVLRSSSSRPAFGGETTKGNSGATTPATTRPSLESSSASSSSSSTNKGGVPAFVKAPPPKPVEEEETTASATSDKSSAEPPDLSEVEEEEATTVESNGVGMSEEEKREVEDVVACAESRADEVGAVPLGKLGDFMAEEMAVQPPLPVLDREEMSEITMDFTAAAVAGNFAPPAATVTEEEEAAPAAPTGSGCYLVFDADGSKLLLHYSHDPVPNAIGFWTPGPNRKIQGFKFKGKHFGKYDLVNDCAGGVTGRKNYYSGWCQFVRAARALEGSVTLFRRADEQRGLDVDVFVYFKDIGGREVPQQTVKLAPDVPVDVSDISAVACCPRHTEFGEYTTLNVDMTRWLTEASNIGAASSFAVAQGTPSSGAFDRKRASSLSSPSFLSAPSSSFDEGNAAAAHNAAGSRSTVQRAASMPLSPVVGDHVPGCYLVYDVESSKLVAHYSRTPVSNAIGFWRPGPNRSIQEFKFKGKNQGRHEIIGNCASATVGRKNFYSGWCQFVRAARGSNGMLTVYIRSLDQRGLDCDLFVYRRKNDSAGRGKAVRVPKSKEFDISDIDAVACLPKNSAFAEYEQMAVDLNRWLTVANNLGAASRFEAF